MINFWLMEQDKTLLEELYERNVGPYNQHILTGSLDNPGLLAKIGKHFVLGRERIWIPKDTAQNSRKLRKHFVLGEDGVWIPKSTDYKYCFVKIDNSSAYPRGLILTPHPAIDVYDHKTRMSERTRFEHVNLDGTDAEDFVTRVFRTYNGTLVSKFNERDCHFVLYSTYHKAPADRVI